MKKIALLPFLALTICLPSCKLVDIIMPSSSSISISVPEDTGEGYHKATEVNKNTKFTSFNDTCPTTGEIEILVCPIEFSDYPFSSSDIEDIKTLTGGTPSETKYWHSLASFYEKSSYGNLKFKFTYADIYDVGYTAKGYFEARQSKQDWADYAIDESVKAYKDAGNSTSKFDSDGDGFMDAVIALYSCPDIQSSSAIENIDPNYECFWAYQYYVINNGNSPSITSPVPYCYFWASLYFFYEATGTKASHSGVDAHTLIHEMGHVLGADDYYNYDVESQFDEEPSGQNVMMAYNILDHDAFTKLSYGWVKPYVPDDSCVISLNPTESSGDCILLADNWNGTAFDEYVILEFYTPTGLNYLDSHSTYPKRSLGYSKPGIRVTHVDNRLAKITYAYSSKSGWTPSSYSFLTDSQVENGVGNIELAYTYHSIYEQIEVASSNTPSYSYSGYNLMSLVSPRKSAFYAGKSNAAKDSDLFHAGDSFKLGSSWSNYFPRGTKLNNGNALPWSFYVNEVSDTQATITITKVA